MIELTKEELAKVEAGANAELQAYDMTKNDVGAGYIYDSFTSGAEFGVELRVTEPGILANRVRVLSKELEKAEARLRDAEAALRRIADMRNPASSGPYDAENMAFVAADYFEKQCVEAGQ